MVSFSSKELSSGVSNKRPLGNNHMHKYRPRKVCSVRDFPPKCGRVGVLIEVKTEESSIGGALTMDDEVKGSMLAQKLLMKEENSVLDVIDEEDKVMFPGFSQSPSSSDSGLRAETFTRPTIPYQQRRVSCVRDFPQHCGRAPSLPTEDQKVILTSAISSGSSVFMGNEDHGAFDEESDGDSEGPTETNEGEKQTVHGLIAAPNCPWTNLHARTCSGKMPGQNTTTKRKPEVVARKTIPKLKFLGRILTQTMLPASNNGSRAALVTHEQGYGGEISTNSSASYPSGNLSSQACMSKNTPVSASKDIDYSDEDSEGTTKEYINARPLQFVLSSTGEVERSIVHGLMAKPRCPWRKEKMVSTCSDGRKHLNKMPEQIATGNKLEVIARKSIPKAKNLGPSLKNKEVPRLIKKTNAADEEDCDGVVPESLLARPGTSKRRNHGDARNKVRETLRLFHTLCRKFMQEQESGEKPGEEGKSIHKIRRIDLRSATIIKERGKEVNTGTRFVGSVPGVEVGDEFQYRVELCIVGIHCHPQGGIEWTYINEKSIATSIIASGSYSDDTELADVLIYSGQGGNVVGRPGRPNQPEDQKLEKGNLALKNSIEKGNPVRVTRGWRETKVVDLRNSKPISVTTYIYDGLYTVTRFWQEIGPAPHGKRVYMFELKRNPGQPELAWKELKAANKSKTRLGLCVKDISGGKERFPIAAYNTLDTSKPPPFIYTSKVTYPNWYRPKTSPGCNCRGRCGDSMTCQCAIKNGGIPYTHNGALVQMKPLVYECGPSCKCPPSCYNRVSQHGIRYKLEIFKTRYRGWGVRSPSSIPSGSFICEYIGEVLEDKEAEKRIGRDQYLFDIGKTYMDSSVRLDEEQVDVSEEDGYTIDAAKFGNLGRFINHSCSPNVYGQNVIYDNGDRKMPHVMLFALENIPPLLELTYNYNYKLDQVHDAHGNVKIKECYCGSAKCRGRLY